MYFLERGACSSSSSGGWLQGCAGSALVVLGGGVLGVGASLLWTAQGQRPAGSALPRALSEAVADPVTVVRAWVAGRAAAAAVHGDGGPAAGQSLGRKEGGDGEMARSGRSRAIRSDCDEGLRCPAGLVVLVLQAGRLFSLFWGLFNTAALLGGVLTFAYFSKQGATASHLSLSLSLSSPRAALTCACGAAGEEAGSAALYVVFLCLLLLGACATFLLRVPSDLSPKQQPQQQEDRYASKPALDVAGGMCASKTTSTWRLGPSCCFWAHGLCGLAVTPLCG